MAVAPIVGGTRFLSIRQLAVAACCIALTWALPVQVIAPAPHTYKRRVLPVSPDVAKFLAVVTLHETSLSFVRLYPDCSIAKTCHSEYLLGL
jgi:hypothetical protein